MRKSGILLHITSLPAPYGVGTLGKAAYDFVDFLEKAGQRVWQVLPLGHTSYGDSPYQAYSSYAGNPYLIDLNMLCEEGLLEKGDLKSLTIKTDNKVDYGFLYETRMPLLNKAVIKLGENIPAEYYTFLEENRFWIEDYAVFMALKEKMRHAGRSSWQQDLRFKNEKCRLAVDEDDVKRYKLIQFLFFKQWFSLKEYANGKGIEIMGDLPIYCACDSSDVWAVPEVFLLDENYLPKMVAGCPPDSFSPLGQRWGNPLYDWEKLKSDGFDWWVMRIKHSMKIFDMVRIDHFRAFDSYFAIDAFEDTAINGRWLEGPKMALFDALTNELGVNLPLIAEDLGFLTDSVKNLLQETGYPGMKLIEFAFESREAGDYLPHNYPVNSVCYVGTHDNDTARGWFESCNASDREMARKYFNLTDEEGISYGLIRGALSAVSKLAIISMQDYLSLSSEGRMNTPSVEGGNWQWRMKKGDMSDKLAKKIREMTLLYGR